MKPFYTKITVALVIALAQFPLAAQNTDQVLEVLDSLSGIYYYDKLKVESGNNRYNYPPGFMPKFQDNVYEERMKQLDKISPFELSYNRTVRKYIDNYTQHPKTTATIISLSKLYFPIFESYLLKYQLPLELKYLSVVESALNPTVKSHMGAAGLWQFTYITAKAYGLTINSYIDERFNPEKATDAACRYIKDLYSIYKDWSLAIAAYNCGAGNVNKAVKKSGKHDFWGVREFLPIETQNYVPAFIAASYSLYYAEEHNIPQVNAAVMFSDIDYIIIKKNTSLSKLSKTLGIPLAQLKYLNPNYYINIVPGNNDKVIVPKNAALTFIEKEASINGKKNNEKVLAAGVVTKPPVVVQKTNNEETDAIHETNNVAIGAPKVIHELRKKVYICELSGEALAVSADKGYCIAKNLSDIDIANSTIPANSTLKGEYRREVEYIQFTFTSASTMLGEIPLRLYAVLYMPGESTVLEEEMTLYVKHSVEQ